MRVPPVIIRFKRKFYCKPSNVVKTIINHPPVITIFIGGTNKNPNGWCIVWGIFRFPNDSYIPIYYIYIILILFLCHSYIIPILFLYNSYYSQIVMVYDCFNHMSWATPHDLEEIGGHPPMPSGDHWSAPRSNLPIRKVPKHGSEMCFRNSDFCSGE